METLSALALITVTTVLVRMVVDLYEEHLRNEKRHRVFNRVIGRW